VQHAEQGQRDGLGQIQVEELADAHLTGQVGQHPAHRRVVFPHRGDQVKVGLHGLGRGPAVGFEIVIAAEDEVVAAS